MLAIINRRTYMIEMCILAILDRHRKDPPRPLASRCWRSLTAAEKICRGPWPLGVKLAILDRRDANVGDH